jgi:hypothetical protein
MRALLTAAGIVAAAHAALVARVDVKVEFDKTFDFEPVRTWAWNPNGPGEVRMARTADDDPEAIRRAAEPVIVEVVTAELTERGLRPATAGPDVSVTYYLLLTVNTSAQTLGQFLPATTAWGLPPFAPATQSLKVMNQGSLVIDVSAKQTVVWRGVAQARLRPDAAPRKREAVLRESVHDLLRRFPPR